jgi:2-polyprenyl-3-methyl-5-hydroxy-6-metoxy-1,4-benzoquinol methylase
MEVACPACQGSEVVSRLRVRTVSDFVIYQCRACGLAFAWPRPTSEELARFYSSTYFAKSQEHILGYSDYRFLPEINAKRMWEEFRALPDIGSLSGRRILDVGCATGGFLSGAKRDGWDCTGVEISAGAADVARREYGLRVLVGDIHSPELSPADFDVVTMWHVLEHMLDPAAALIRARSLLQPNGLLFVELPNWNSVGRTVRGVNWSALTPPEHINFFTPRSLRLLVNRSGFRTLQATSVYPSFRDQARLDRPGRLRRQLKYAIALVASAIDRGGYVRLRARSV